MIRLTTTNRLKALEDRLAALEARPAIVEIIMGTDRAELRAIIKQQLNELVPLVIEAAKSKLLRGRG